MNRSELEFSLFRVRPSVLFGAALVIGVVYILLFNFVGDASSTFVVLLGGLTIMGAYIFLIVRNEVDEITREQKADSCYYLGFILTLIAMIMSLIQFDSSLAGDGRAFESIVKNFGLALVTTVVGLTARITWLHLHSDRMIDAEETIRNRLLKEADAFQLQIQRITASFTSLADKTAEVTEPLVKNLDLLYAGLKIPDGLGDDLSALSKDVGTLHAQLSNVTNVLTTLNTEFPDDFDVKVQQLVKSLSSVTPSLTSDLEDFAAELRNCGPSIGTFNSTMSGLSNTLNTLQDSVEIPNGLSQAFGALATNITRLHTQLENLSRLMSTLSSDATADFDGNLRKLVATLEREAPAFTSSLEKFNVGIGASIEEIERFGGSMADMLVDTNKTYIKVNEVLSENADYIRKELK